jgi:hypothetical protein
MHLSVRNQFAGTVKEVKLLGVAIFFASNYNPNVRIISIPRHPVLRFQGEKARNERQWPPASMQKYLFDFCLP